MDKIIDTTCSSHNDHKFICIQYMFNYSSIVLKSIMKLNKPRKEKRGKKNANKAWKSKHAKH